MHDTPAVAAYHRRLSGRWSHRTSQPFVSYPLSYPFLLAVTGGLGPMTVRLGGLSYTLQPLSRLS